MIYWLLMMALIYLIIYNITNLKFLEIRDYPIYQKAYDYSYLGIKKRCQAINYAYSTKRYVMECILILLVVCIISYITMQSLYYCLILSIIIASVFPYYRYLKIKCDYQQLIYNEVLLYASSGILFIQEKKNTMRILKDCSSIVKLPLKNSIEKAIIEIEKTADFEAGLKLIERDFKQAPIQKLHVLLKSSKNQGGYNINLYRYLYKNIEDLEQNINEYLIKKHNNRNVFYLMVLLNILAIYCFKTIFNIDDKAFDFSIFSFYILNMLTVIYYEYYLAHDAQVQT